MTLCSPSIKESCRGCGNWHLSVLLEDFKDTLRQQSHDVTVSCNETYLLIRLQNFCSIFIWNELLRKFFPSTKIFFPSYKNIQLWIIWTNRALFVELNIDLLFEIIPQDSVEIISQGFVIIEPWQRMFLK